MAAAAVAKSFSYRDLLLFTFVSGIATVVGGLVSELALGTFHPFEAEYRFAGFMHPNFTSWNCSLCLIAIVALARNKPRLVRKAYTFAFVGVTGFLLLTKSRGALAAAVLGLLTYSILASSRRRIFTVAYATATIVCAVFLFGGPNTGAPLAQALLLGRTDDAATLTGRTPFWENELLPHFMESPIAGYGYDSFWTASRYLNHASAAAGDWFFPDSHNTLIEIALGLGAVGLVLYITVFAVAMHRSVRASDSSPDCTGPFAAAVLVCSFVNSNLSSAQLKPYLGSFVCLIVLAQIALSKRSVRRFVSYVPARYFRRAMHLQ
jgi:O-antigen ligase